MTCPKCKAPRPAGAVECPRCGVIYARYDAAEAKKRAADAEKLRSAQAARQAAEKAARQTPEPEPAATEMKPADTSKIVNCPACGKPVSIMADNCPSCGHPVDKSLRLSPLEKKLNAIVGYAAIALFFAIISGVYYCSHQLTKSVTGGTGAELRPAPVTIKNPNIRKNVPFTIPEGGKVLGCHDIGDYWMLRGAANDGRDALREQLRPRVAAGKCGRVPAGRGTAIEVLPAGVAEIRDSQGSKWYIHASVVEDYETR